MNYSVSIPTRARCKCCGKQPKFYFHTKYRNFFKDVKSFLSNFEWVVKYHYVFNSSSFIFMNFPLDSINIFSYCPTYKSYSPRLHFAKGVKSNSDIMVHLICECGKSIWSIHSDYAIEKRPDILNRKSKNIYTQQKYVR